MKKTILLFVTAFIWSWWNAGAQAVNEPANWPNTNWTLDTIAHTGEGSMDIEANPLVDPNFAYDDDDTGSGSHDEIAAVSPVIDLTPAADAGQNYLMIEGEYVFNYLSSNEKLAIQYWDADAEEWVDWHVFPQEDTPGAPTDNYCSGTPAPYQASLDISGFTATQLSGFKYRIYYNDNITGDDGWRWGFCFSSPTVYSASVLPPEFTVTPLPDCDNYQFSAQVVITDLGGSSAVTVSDDQGSAEQTVSATNDTIVMGPYTSGTEVTIIVTSADDTTVQASETVVYYCPPPNDECSGAVEFTVQPYSNECTDPYEISNNGATGSEDINGIPSCDSGYAGGDVWFSFTAPDNGQIFVDVISSEWSTTYMALYSDCGDTLDIACEYVYGTGTMYFEDLTAGQTYYVRMWDYNNDNFGSVQFCLMEVPDPPANDECSGAVALTVEPYSPDGPCSNTYEAINLGATGSEATNGEPSCNSAYAGGDVWFSFTAPETGGVIFRIDSTDWSTTYIALYENCADTLDVACEEEYGTGNITFNNLTPGQTYYARMWDSGNNNLGSMYFCVMEFPEPPANDECENAIELTDQEALDFDSAEKTTGTVFPATYSGIPAPECDGYTGTADDDVWYSFTAAADTVYIGIDDAFDGVVELFEGTCDSLVSIACKDVQTNGILLLTAAVTPGETYYFRVYSYASTYPDDPTFEVAVWHEPGQNVSTLTASEFTFYPNPTEGIIRLTGKQQPNRIGIYDLTGKLLMDIQNPSSTLDISTLPAGIYMMRVQAGDKEGIYRIIKQ